MRRAPTYLAATFLIIQVTRVAEFAMHDMKAGWLGLVFSIAIACGVYVGAYFSRNSMAGKNGQGEDAKSTTTRRWAMLVMVICTLGDGYFNLTHVLRTVTDPSLQIPAYIYGAFPTVLAAMMGLLQGRIDRIPKGGKQAATNVAEALSEFVMDWLNAMKPKRKRIRRAVLPTEVPNIGTSTRKEPAPSTRSSTKRKEIEEYLAGNTEATVGEVARLFEVKPPYVSRIRSGMTISSNGRGHSDK